MSYPITYAKNTSGASDTWVGQVIADGAYYQIDDTERLSWQTNDKVLQDIGAGDLTIAKDDSGTNDISGTAAQIDYLKNVDTTPKDNDGARLSRPKMAPTGWTYQARGFEFETSKLNSIFNEKYDGTDYGGVTIKFYDNADVELTTQASIDTDCVKTEVDFEPTYDYELIGGFVAMDTGTTSDIRMWCIGVPDLTEAQGGSKVMINGINMKFANDHDRVRLDGRTGKRMNYDATYHTNKLRKIFTHPAGAKCKFLVCFEHYKA